jgi:hypothetical protein
MSRTTILILCFSESKYNRWSKQISMKTESDNHTNHVDPNAEDILQIQNQNLF